MTEKQYWFAERHYGYGAGLPIAWQGWALLTALVGGVALATQFDGSMRWMTIAVLLASILPVMAEKTRGGWHWRWGGRG